MKLYDVIRKEQLEGKKSKKEPIVEVIAQTEYDGYDRIRTRPPAWKKLALIAGCIAFVGLLYVVGMKLVHARVVINERRIPFSVDGLELELTHEQEADAGRLSFQAMVVTTEVSREVFGSELSQSASKAKGKAVLFNEYSKSAQSIKSGTTLTAANGKRYVTQASVSIPGYTAVGTKRTPGTVTVSIIAAEVGGDYNSDSTSFTIAGWTGSRAKQLYGRSAGPISGGEAGVKHMLSGTERETVYATLQAQLSERLKRETRAQIPEHLVTFPELQVLTINPDSFQSSGEQIKFSAKLSGTMVSYLIPRDLLEQSIATHAIRDAVYPHVSIPTLGDTAVTPITPLPTDPEKIPESIIVSVKGSGTIITKLPVEKTKESLVGISRRSFSSVMERVPEIDTARFALYPFWAPFFPVTVDDIAITIK